MKILIASDIYPPSGYGGIATTVANLIKQLVKHSHQVVLLTSGKSGSVLETGNIKIYFFPQLKLPLFRHSPIALSLGGKIGQIFDIEKVDIVHIKVAQILGKAVLTEAQKRQIPVVYTLHHLPENSNSYIPRFKPLRKSYAWTIWQVVGFFVKRANFITTPSQFGAKLLSSRFKINQVKAVSNGIDLTLFKRQVAGGEAKSLLNLPGKKVLLYVGRLCTEKNLEVLIKATQIISTKNQNVLLILTGDGPLKKSLQKLSRKLNIASFIDFTGYVDDARLKLYYQAADIFVMPSTAELQGISVLEAMAYSLPVVAANAKALPELVENGVNGYLFNPQNFKDLAKKINLLLLSPNLEQLGKISLNKVKSHNLRRTTQQYLGIYQKLLKEGNVQLKRYDPTHFRSF